MARKGGTKEGFSHDSSISMPSEQRTSESTKQKISRIHDTFPETKKETIAKILQFYDDDESKAIDAITRDGGREALSHLAETGSLKNKNNKNKKKKKKGKRDAGVPTTASFDADDSSSLHSSGNIDADIEKECQRVENGNGFLPDAVDEIENVNSTFTNHERLQDSEPEPISLNLDTRSAASTPDQELCQSLPLSAYDKSNPPVSKQEPENIPCSSPLSDISDKHDEQDKNKNRAANEHYKYPPRQRTSSFRRSKTSSLSEDSSSQHNSQNAAAKRGIDRCKKDLNRQTISLQRIHSQVEKGLEESARKIKNVFGELQKQLENRKKEVEAELEKRKVDALNLIKSRQDLAVELKRRVDRSPSMTDNEWNELRSDIKLFVTERKYDDDLGKTIWFQWTDISDSFKSFGEVQPVKNVYSQRSNSVLASGETTQNNPEPSPSSSLANEDINDNTTKNDVAVIADTVEDETLTTVKEETSSVNKPKTNEGRTYGRVYSNRRFTRFNPNFQSNRGFRGNRGGGSSYPRSNYNRNNYQASHNRFYNDYRNHPHQDNRDGRVNENQPYSSNERNVNNNYKDNKNDRNPGRGQHSNMRYHPHPRYRDQHQSHRQNFDNTNTFTDPSAKPSEASVSGKPAVLNGIDNN